MVQILIAHAKGEEDLAETLAEPLASAGYEVLHHNAILVGESLADKASQAIAAGSPVVICGTVRAVGTSWARRLVNATRLHSGARIFAVQMEEDADLELLALDGKVALYWQDPARAVGELLDALAEYYPLDEPAESTNNRALNNLMRRFRDLALSTCDIVHLAYLPNEDRELATKELLLRSLYVSLRVGVQENEALDPEKALLDPEGRAGEFDPLGEERFSIGERLKESRRLVVLGDPGAGKSTMLRWIATAYLLRLKSDPDWQELPDVHTLPDADWLPLLIRCREIDEGRGLGSLEDIVRRQLRHDAQSCFSDAETAALTDMLLGALAKGRVLLLIDGLDEISDPRLRARFCVQVEQIHVAYPEASIVVTSRIVGYKELGLRIGRGFEHVRVLDLTPEDKDDFARRWCTVAEPLPGRDAATRELISDIHSSDRIERLTGNPMLLTTMALVKKKVGKLPSRRADLYREAVDVLLSWRSSASERIDRYEALPQLQYLAYAMCDAGVQQLREDEVIDTLVRMREEFPNVWAAGNHSPLEFLRLLESRTGILVESGHTLHNGALVPVYEFRHLTFQEYLAGLALVAGRFPGKDMGKSLADQVAALAARTSPGNYPGSLSSTVSWREVLRLCVMSCNDDDVGDVLGAIALPMEGEGEEGSARSRATLALACLADEPNVSERVALEIIDRFIEGIGQFEAANTTEEIQSSRWGPVLIRRIITAWLNSPAEFWRLAGNLATMLQRTIPADNDEGRLETWLQLRVAQLAAPDVCTAIEAAIALEYAAFLKKVILLPDMVPRLMSLLSRGPCESTSGAWALKWLSDSVWNPSPGQIDELDRVISTETLPAEALAYLMSCFDVADGPLLHDKIPRLIEPFVTATSNGRGLLADQYSRLFPQTIDPLRRLAHHADPAVRDAALVSLAKSANESVADTLLEVLPSVENATVYEAMARALGRLGDSRAKEPLLRLMTEHSLEPPSPVVAALAWLGVPLASSAVERAMNGPSSPQHRAATLWSLASLETDDHTRKLLSHDLDGRSPGRDPAQEIDEETLSISSEATDLPVEEVRARYEALARRYPLKLAWLPRQRQRPEPKGRPA
ncbi:TIR domain-containing protein [Streptomyces sp. TLI_55]|uniref:NACHT domain-containing protein n=1 Tax=Streptomyces sp. TLI_55 TaxID=1938861 RepID=UPI000BD50DB9|nr:NACHT domain-containing protein [Streptomyces sp. TLI_55]SNX64172.1 TIR domain-containing protein [Streptomyces sp. TLI_55]